MLLSLFNCVDNHNVVNKQLTLMKNYDIQFKNNQNILTPVLTIYAETGLPDVDYAHIVGLGRYYFITNIEPKPNNIYILHLEIDVVETYKQDILNAKKVNYQNSVSPEINILKSDYQPTDDVSYILSTIGGVKPDDSV